MEKLQFKKTKILKTENVNVTEAFFRVSYRIARNDDTIGQTFIKPCVKDIVSCMLNEEFAQRIDALQLSNTTVPLCLRYFYYRFKLCSKYG